MAEQVGAPKTDRLGFIEGLRGLAAFYVLGQHICTMVDPRFTFQRAGAQPEWLARTMGMLWYGHFAVAAFIVLSGFCLQMSLYRSGDGRITDWKRFLKRRCWRILPPYYACLILSLITVHFVTSRHQGPPWNQYLPVTPENLTAHVFMIHNLSRDWMYKINGVLWSISIEFQLYFLFPLLCLGIWRLGARVMLPAATFMVFTALNLYASSEKLYVWYFGLFVLGMAGARWTFDRRLSRPHAPAMACVALFAFATAIASIQWTKELAIRDTLMGIAVVSALVSGCQNPRAFWVRPLGSKPMVALGAFSYSLYLVHHLVLQWLTHYKPESINTPVRHFAYLALGIPLVLGVCYAFYRAFEKPFINRGKSGPRKILQNRCHVSQTFH